MHRLFTAIALSWLILSCSTSLAQESLSKSPILDSDSSGRFSKNHARAFFAEYCIDCHSKDSGSEGEAFFSLSLDRQGFPLLGELDAEAGKAEEKAMGADADSTWVRVREVIRDGEMPPPEVEEIDVDLAAQVVSWLDPILRAQSSIGGTPPRRLSRDEYRLTLESLLGIKPFDLPDGFPIDRPHHGFDNQAEGLVVSPALLEAYANCARLAADQIFPPNQKPPDHAIHIAQPSDLVISYSSAKSVNGAMRLGMKCDPIQRSCTWPSRIEAKVSAQYQIVIRASAFKPTDAAEPMVLKVFARDVSSADSVSHRTLRLLQEINVSGVEEQEFSFEATLYEGQTIVLHWANATLDSDREDKQELREFFEAKQRDNPKYLSAWHAMLKGEQGQGFRGGIGWDRVSALLQRKDLELINPEQEQALLKKIVGNPVLYAETVVFDIFENGPALQIHEVQIHGPGELVDGPREEKQERLRNRLFGSDGEDYKAIIERFLTRAFRRPIDQESLNRWIKIFERHIEEGNTLNQSMHLLVRNVLLSPRFLYRCLGDEELDSHDLASRLSYFLTKRPPDAKLLQKVGQLQEVRVLRSEASRLLPTSPKAIFVQSFTEQWLGTRGLSEINPDPSLKFSLQDQRNAKLEVEHFFAELLRENRPVQQLVDPDFTWVTPRIAQDVYQMTAKFEKKKPDELQRISLQPGGRHGGLLGMSALLMATGNGVNTQPVTRGVWVLERVLGMTVPPPPSNVPPITPDTRGSKTPRDLLELHTSELACSRCHRRIDPFGLVMENFDPVGRWREQWPDGEQKVDSSVVLFDGSEIRNVIDLKIWLRDHPEKIGIGFAKHLMVYATGRPMSYAEQREIEEIVAENIERREGLRDLVLDLICSPVFSAK